MVDDFVRKNGYLTLGTRLKRLGERMQTDVAEVSNTLGMPTGAGLLTALGAIETNGALTIGGLADALGVSQPAATKLAGRLAESGLITLTDDPADKRSRILATTLAGISIVRTGQTLLWPAVEAAVRNLCEATTGSLLDRLDTIEASLSEIPLSERIRERLQDRKSDDDAS